MDRIGSFKSLIEQEYTCQGGALVMGSAMLEGEGVTGTLVKIPIKTMKKAPG